MRTRFFAATSLAALLLLGCASVPYQAFEARRDLAPPKHLKVLLVGASDDGARFARSVLQLRDEWLAHGVKKDEIACYLTAPSKERWSQNPSQFESMRAAFGECYPATLPLLRQHLAAAAANRPPYLHFFVTGHGNPPVEILEKIGVEGVAERKELRKKVPGTGHWHIPFDEHEQFDWWKRLENGEPLDDVVLTPVALARMLNVLQASTHKVVVLDGCFTGGFLEGWTQGGKKSGLVEEVPNLTVLTAAAATRYSFGGYWDGPVFFGAAIVDALAEQKNTPAEGIDWKKVFQYATSDVESRERIAQGELASLPQFRTNGTKTAANASGAVSPPSRDASTR